MHFLWIFILTLESVSGNLILENPKLLSQSISNIFIVLPQSLEAIYLKVLSKSYPDRGAKTQTLYEGLRGATSEWHEPVLKGLEQFPDLEITSFWITNKIYVKNATPKVIKYLLGQSGIKSISEEIIIPYPESNTIEEGKHELSNNPHFLADNNYKTYYWNIKKTGAHEIWTKTTGKGIHVGFIDSGAFIEHEALQDNYAGAHGRHGWFDALDGTKKPHDGDREQGRGTAIISIAVGTIDGIGMAPEARYQICKAFNKGGGSNAAFLKCGEWISCPTDPQGNNRDCSQAPEIASNSWGHNSSLPGGWFDDVIKFWRNADIIPVFSVGKSQKGLCSSAYYPAIHKDVISVGATNEDDRLSRISAKGPKKQDSCGDSVVPLIVAPGQFVYGAAVIGTSDYWKRLVGSAYAAPHVSGGIALLLSKFGAVSYQQVTSALFYTANTDLRPSGKGQCGKQREDEFPNNVYGWGRLSISAAYEHMSIKS